MNSGPGAAGLALPVLLLQMTGHGEHQRVPGQAEQDAVGIPVGEGRVQVR